MATKVISPAHIERELAHIWDSFQGTKKMRASLFNLIFFTQKKTRADYVQAIAQKVIEKFPARIIFVSLDPELKGELEASVSVMPVGSGEYDIACDYIQLKATQATKERVPFIILSHLIPDLPIYLVWEEDPCKNDPLFDQLQQISTRTIFDSEATENLPLFTHFLLQTYESSKCPVADLNWARIESWRDLLSTTFYRQDRLQYLQKASLIQIFYNAKESAYYCHTAVQPTYLQGWIASQMGWQFQEKKQSSKQCSYIYKKPTGSLTIELYPEQHPQLAAGTIASIELASEEAHFSFGRNLDIPHQISMRFSTPNYCEIPLKYLFAKAESGQSLVKEISHKGMSEHFLKLLHLLKNLPK